MRIVDSFPYGVREIEHVWIPLRDGARLSARLWLPEGAGPAPAVIEYIPYRKRDDTRWRDEPMHGYFAGHGYASVRIDVRGSGSSDGVLADEYSEQEWDDGLEAISWVAAQPWCDGAVGLIGKSWGGINALQIAALDPPELRCVIAVCATDDRWATDAHWMGGCLLNENLIWGSVLQTLATRPQDPELVGEDWRRTWLRRMGEAPLYVARWLRHSSRCSYWKRGSVCEHWDRLRVPVLAVSGWADAYADAVPRLLAGHAGVARGLVGPWAHVYPHNGAPGPAVGFLQMACSWWSRWLRGAGSPVAEPTREPAWEPASEPIHEPTREPAYRVWMTEGGGRPWAEPTARGRWVGEAAWPSPSVRIREWRLRGPGERAPRVVPWTATGALAAGSWCPFSPADLPGEQAPDDHVSTLFDHPPLTRRLEILGAPEVELDLACDRPHGMVAVRLCDVAPDGTSVRVSYGLLDLAFRDGFHERRPLRPGRRHRVRVPLRHCAHAFPEEHRVRVAVSSSYWPVAWPLAEPFRLQVFGGVVRLPERPPRAEDARLPALDPPEAAPSPAFEVPDPSPGTRGVRHDPTTGWTTATLRHGWRSPDEPALAPVPPIGMETGWAMEEVFGVRPDAPASARASVRHVVSSRRAGWSTRLEVKMSQERSPGGFRVRAEVVGHEGGVEVGRRVLEDEISD